MGQQPSQDTSASETKEDKRLSQESSNDSYATRLAGSFYGDYSDSQEKQFNRPVLNTVVELDTATQLENGSPQPRFPRRSESRVSPLSTGGIASAIRQNEMAVSDIEDETKEGVSVKSSRGRRPPLPRKGFQTTVHPNNSPYKSPPISHSQTLTDHAPRILPSGLKPPRPQPRIASLPSLESNSPASTPPGTPRRRSDDSFATSKEATVSASGMTPPAPTPPQTPDRQNDVEAPLKTDEISGKRRYQKPLSYRKTMLLGFGLTAFIGPFSVLVPVFWREYRQRKSFASFGIGALSALVVWLAFSIVLALVLVKQ
ncbi:unnamed protein product [Agarophyton chilense]|eukprot:gb/GEZJ01004036.1/.p1 GENE.gb/GEZJ01004036.1/~~gb/GEZJ01004036.1/.p1  ORF type:complete len:314 (-),score=29.76 gb/GEZJ01004036.1/:562-1503(-)